MASAVQLAGPSHAVEFTKAAARWIIEKMAELINLKKHTRGEKFSVDVDVFGDSNNVSVVNIENLRIVVPRETVELLHSRIIGSALSKIAAPLLPNRIESAEISSEGGGPPVKATIRGREREYFRLKPVATSRSEIELEGILESLNKRSNKGRFKLYNGKSVRYQYVGGDRNSFYAEFIRRGPVRASGTAISDDEGQLRELFIESVVRPGPPEENRPVEIKTPGRKFKFDKKGD